MTTTTVVQQSLRRVAERGSRSVVLKRRLPTRFGHDPVFVSPGAMLKYWWTSLGRADPSLLSWAGEFVHEGATVWDVGANIGLFAFAAAHVAGPTGHIVAVEADTWLVNLLRKSARSGESARAPVDIVPAAVAGSIDLARFHIAERSRASNFLEGADFSSQAGGTRHTELVISVTLDWLLERLPAPTVLKIDVEGAEAEALSGAEQLLRGTRPLILCEVASRNAETVQRLLSTHGYRFYDLDQPGDRRPIPLPVTNTLAMPR